MPIKLNKKTYLKNSAATLMTDKVPLALLDDSIADVEMYLKSKKEQLESINYIYVLDRNGVLLGAVSIKEVFRQAKDKKLSEFITDRLIVAFPHSTAESVVNLALAHNIKAVPVVNENGKFLGAVLSDTILEIAHREIEEDLAKIAGIQVPKIVSDSNSLSVINSLRNRLPWLVVGMFGGFLMSKTIAAFEMTLAENIIIASFIPLIVYMASAVQTQIGFFIVRDLAFNPKINFLIYAFRQLRVVFFIGLGISALVFVSSYLFYSALTVSIVLALALFLAIISSIITGVFIPFLFQRLKFDPASASGPIATIIQDLISIVIYLLVAKSFL